MDPYRERIYISWWWIVWVMFWVGVAIGTLVA